MHARARKQNEPCRDLHCEPLHGLVSCLFIGLVIPAELQLVQIQLELGTEIRVRRQRLGRFILVIGRQNVLFDQLDGVLDRKSVV